MQEIEPSVKRPRGRPPISARKRELGQAPEYLLAKKTLWSAQFVQSEFLQRLAISQADGNAHLTLAAQIAQCLGVSLELAQAYLDHQQPLPAELVVKASLLVQHSGASVECLMGEAVPTPEVLVSSDEMVFLDLYRKLSQPKQAAFIFVFRLHILLHGLPRDMQCGIFKSLWTFRALDQTGEFEQSWGHMLDIQHQQFRIREGFSPLQDQGPVRSVFTAVHELYGVFGPEVSTFARSLDGTL